MAKGLVHKLHLPAFQAPHALLVALAHLDQATGQPAGLLKVRRGAVRP